MIQTCEGFYTSQVVVWDFFHQQYFSLEPKTYFGDKQLYTFYTASPICECQTNLALKHSDRPLTISHLPCFLAAHLRRTARRD